MSEAQQAKETGRTGVRIGGLLVFALIVASLAWYLVGARFIPYTSQARVQGFVVGVAPKVGGVVTEVWVGNDQEVEQGQPLFQIDRQSYVIAVEKARADLARARSQHQASAAAVESAQASLRAAQASLQSASQDAARQEKLHREEPGAISVRRLELAQASFEAARAKVAAAEAEIQRAIDNQQAAEESLKAARSALEQAELDLENTRVVAPARGVITDLRTDVGHYAAAGAAVMTLVALRDVWVNAEFTENNLGHLRMGTPVELVLDVLPGRVFQGKVRSIGLGVSAGQAPPAGVLPEIQNSRDWLRQAQRFPVNIDFDPADHEELQEKLRIGGQVEVIAYTEGHTFLRGLGELYIRLKSWLSYAY